MAHLALPPKVNVPATPAVHDVDINTLYDMTNARLLGKGGFSEVVAAQHLATGEMRALKIMQRAALRGKKAEMVAHEKEILRRTCHPNVVSLYETIQNSDLVYFALDLMDEDLFEFIVRHKCINESLTRVIMFQLLSAIRYLHEQSIVHRDIKPENILINVRPRKCSSSGSGSSAASSSAVASPVESATPRLNVAAVDCAQLDVMVKLADFGLAKLVMEWDVSSTPCGTSFYIAPEVIRGIEAQGAKPLCTNQRLVKSVDVWSAGIVFYLLLCGRPPFRGQVKTPEERRALLSNIDHGLLFRADHGWNDVSDAAKDLIVRMLEQDSAKRITAADALRHTFFVAHGFTQPVASGDLLQKMREQSLRAREHQQQLQQQQQQQQQLQHNTAKPETVCCYYSSGAASVPPPPPPPPPLAALPGHHVSPPSAPAKRSLFANVAHFFGANNNNNNNNGGSGNGSSTRKHGKGGGDSNSSGSTSDGDRASTPSNAATAEEQQLLRAALAELQQGVLHSEDVEGDETSYRATMPYKAAMPARPAVMNSKMKPGPAALKR